MKNTENSMTVDQAEGESLPPRCEAFGLKSGGFSAPPFSGGAPPQRPPEKSAGEGGFEELGAAPFFAARLLERGISGPTEIQRRVIPRLLGGENLLFQAPTGTGKTFAYFIPLFQRYLAGEPGPGRQTGPLILICAPTYELCSQIKAEADFLLRGWGPRGCAFRAGLLIGSASMGRQIEALKTERPAVIVGNPGRLLQLGRMGKLRPGSVRALVLDEGDRLLADELRGETEELVRLLPEDRQSAACSATISAKSRERLLPLLGVSCETEEAGEGGILRERIGHWAFFCEQRRKTAFLRSFLAAAMPKKGGFFKALVFTGRGWDAGKIVSQLQYHKVNALGLYGDMDKLKRREAAEAFRSGRVPVLVSSDLAARGLDFPGISHIIALDVPADGEAYIHRAGRTARAGRRGIMVSIGDGEEMRRLAALEKRLGIAVYPKELHNGRITAPLPPEEDQA